MGVKELLFTTTGSFASSKSLCDDTGNWSIKRGKNFHLVIQLRFLQE